MIKKNDSSTKCAVDFAFKRIGGKYKGRILWHLHTHNVMRYGELKRSLTDVTPKMLTQTLKELEGNDLINRKAYPEIPPKVEYSLTSIGKELIPFIKYLQEWGEKQLLNES